MNTCESSASFRPTNAGGEARLCRKPAPYVVCEPGGDWNACWSCAHSALTNTHATVLNEDGDEMSIGKDGELQAA